MDSVYFQKHKIVRIYFLSINTVLAFILHLTETVNALSVFEIAHKTNEMANSLGKPTTVNTNIKFE